MKWKENSISFRSLNIEDLRISHVRQNFLPYPRWMLYDSHKSTAEWAEAYFFVMINPPDETSHRIESID